MELKVEVRICACCGRPIRHGEDKPAHEPVPTAPGKSAVAFSQLPIRGIM